MLASIDSMAPLKFNATSHHSRNDSPEKEFRPTKEFAVGRTARPGLTTRDVPSQISARGASLSPACGAFPGRCFSIAFVALAGLRGDFRPGSAIGRERAAYIVRFFERAVLGSADETFVCSRVDQFPFCHVASWAEGSSGRSNFN
jgi:hypothetical protein